ncbi:DUF4129 domain-containing protein [Auraticoccus cholistanensis]|uniref:DUF4129 domain-containing protein n=1 Tax=Auraticoccus cholistanensis TaxID=2656650 RepID=UPI0018D22DC2
MIPLDVPVETAREEARRLVAEELARARYDIERPAWLDRLLQRAVELLESLLRRVGDLVEWLVELFPDGGGRSGGGDSGGWLVAGVVVLVLALALLLWRVGLPQLNRSSRDARVGTHVEVSPQDYRTLAEQAAAAGDWTRAVVEEFRALVRELEQLTVIDPRPSRTATEVAWRASVVVPEAEADLRRAAAAFNDAVYGGRPAGAGQWEELRATSARVLAAARQVDLGEVPA